MKLEQLKETFVDGLDQGQRSQIEQMMRVDGYVIQITSARRIGDRDYMVEYQWRSEEYDSHRGQGSMVVSCDKGSAPLKNIRIRNFKSDDTQFHQAVSSKIMK